MTFKEGTNSEGGRRSEFGHKDGYLDEGKELFCLQESYVRSGGQARMASESKVLGFRSFGQPKNC